MLTHGESKSGGLVFGLISRSARSGSRMSAPIPVPVLGIAALLLMIAGFGLEARAAEPPVRLGVGHAMAISLKDEYRKQIIPLAAAAGAEYTALYILRDTATATEPGEDGSFMDLDVQAFNRFDARQGYNKAWWSRFADFLRQCREHKITPIVSLYDFCCSGPGPFGGYNDYDSVNRDYAARVVRYLKDAGIDYIINIGVERGPGDGLGPSTAFLNDCIAHLMELGVSLREQMCISKEIMLDRHDLAHVPGYVTGHGSRNIPGNTAGFGRWRGSPAYTINDEERMAGGGYPVECHHGPGGRGSGWGGSGTTEQYVNYLQAAHSGIACLNFWHLKAFNDCKDAVGGEDMEKIFAPNQRAAMIEIRRQQRAVPATQVGTPGTARPEGAPEGARPSGQEGRGNGKHACLIKGNEFRVLRSYEQMPRTARIYSHRADMTMNGRGV